MSDIEEYESPATAVPVSLALGALFESFNRSDAPGLIVGISYREKIVYKRAFGLASIEHGIANSVTTRSRIGSTSKHFTCLAALLLAEEGKLDISSSVSCYLPELPLLQGAATLRQLMTHTSGYRCSLSTGFIADGMAIRPAGAALKMQSRQSDVNFPSGERLMYNNGGYHLLSLVIQRVSGMPFAQFLKERIFAPIGMVDTASVPNDFEIHPRVATLYTSLPAGGYRRGIFPTEELLGEGAIISTVDDMLRWLSHMRGHKKVGTEFSWTEMLTRVKLNNGRPLNYALGLMRHDYRGVEVIHHPGGVIGGCSQMLTVPSHALDIVIIANTDSADPKRMAFEVVDAVLGDELTAGVLKADSDAYKPLLGRRYFSASREGYEFGFDDVAGKLGLSIMNRPAAALNVDGESLRLELLDDRSSGPYELVLPATVSDAPPPTMMMSNGGNLETFQLLPQVSPSTIGVGVDLVGHYRVNDLDADAEVLIEGEALLLKVYGEFGTTLMDLRALSAELFAWEPRAGVPEIGTLHVRRMEGKVSLLLLDSLRTRHLLFERLAD